MYCFMLLYHLPIDFFQPKINKVNNIKNKYQQFENLIKCDLSTSLMTFPSGFDSIQ